MKRVISWLALPRPRLLDPRHSHSMLQQAGATWPALRSVQTPFHTSPSTPHNSQTCLTPCAHDPFSRAHIAAAQSRVAAPTLSDPRPPPPGPTFSPYRDGHCWCSKCPRRGFATIPGLMRHFTTPHAGTQVDEPTRALLVAVERVTCTDPACGGFRRAGARTLQQVLPTHSCSPPGHRRLRCTFPRAAGFASSRLLRGVGTGSRLDEHALAEEGPLQTTVGPGARGHWSGGTRSSNASSSGSGRNSRPCSSAVSSKRF